MESMKDKSPQSAVSSGSTLLRYPLRSMAKNEKTVRLPTDSRIPAASKREKPVSTSVSKSINVLDLSGKQKAPKPPRRQSIPSKSPGSPALVSVPGSTTPLPGSRRRIMARAIDKRDTPVSDASRSIVRRKFSVLSSVSYWLSQIKLSESASKHSISLGFFRLALESECESIPKLRVELKAYARRHHILELGECAKEVLSIYGILEEVEQWQGSESPTLVHVDEDTASDVTVVRHRNVKSASISSENSSSSVAHGTDTKKNGGRRRNNTPSVHTSVNRSLSNLGGISVRRNSTRNTRSSVKKDTSAKSPLKEEIEEDSFDALASHEEHENKENVEMESDTLEEQAVA